MAALAIGIGLFMVLSPREESAPDTVATVPESNSGPEPDSGSEAPAEITSDQAPTAPEAGKADLAQPASPAPKAQAKTKTGTETEADIDTDTGVDTDTQPDPSPEPVNAPDSAEAAPAARQEAGAAPRPEAAGESEPVSEPDPETVSKAEAAEVPDVVDASPRKSSQPSERSAEPDTAASAEGTAQSESVAESESAARSGANEEAAGTSKPTTGNAETEPAAGADLKKGPSFDIVRVEPGGAAVIAGRAEPNSEVTVLEDGKPIGGAKANPRGQFVVLPGRSLKTGRSELTLESTSSSGETRESASAVVLATPEAPERENGAASDADRDGEAATGSGTSASSDGADTRAAPERPFALKVPRRGSGGAEVLQHPGPDVELEAEAGAETSPAPRLAIRVVQYTNRGGLVVTGVARPGRRVAASLDGDVIGKGRARRGSGRWSIAHPERIPAGLYTLSVAARNAEGNVLERVRTPFASQPRVSDLDGERMIVVQPGSNLWTVARRTYGEGVQYTTIYNANEDQIDDPDLIYPGQVFVLPEKAGAQ